MAPSTTYSVADVLAVARNHPFYHPEVRYPPDNATIQELRDAACKTPGSGNIKGQALLHKNNLYSAIERLVNDTSRENTYRKSVYASTTGGGSGGKPLFFATDVVEQRQQRALWGSFMRKVGFLQPDDWVLTLHTAGRLYRSLDLTLETFENAGASVLSGGSFLSPTEIINFLIQFNINILTGDGGQVVETVHHISKLPQAERALIRLDKLIYTSEPLTTTQRRYVRSVLGPKVRIGSVLGSAEAGPYAVSLPEMEAATAANRTSEGDDVTYTDFLYDSRAMFIEIFPLDSLDGDQPPTPLPDGELGLVSQTSLTRLRNPLVRYMTGDVASIHNAPELPATATMTKEEQSHLRVLRLRGRDPRFSFNWAGEYFDFGALAALMATMGVEDETLNGETKARSRGDGSNAGILQWQVLLSRLEHSSEAQLEVRILMTKRNEAYDRADDDEGQDAALRGEKKRKLKHGDDGTATAKMLKVDGREIKSGRVFEKLKTFFNVDESCERRMRIMEVYGLEGFERSTTGKKVIRFIDRFTD